MNETDFMARLRDLTRRQGLTCYWPSPPDLGHFVRDLRTKGDLYAFDLPEEEDRLFELDYAEEKGLMVWLDERGHIELLDRGASMLSTWFKTATPYVNAARVEAVLKGGPATAKDIASIIVMGVRGIASAPGDTRRVITILREPHRYRGSPFYVQNRETKKWSVQYTDPRLG